MERCSCSKQSTPGKLPRVVTSQLASRRIGRNAETASNRWCFLEANVQRHSPCNRVVLSFTHPSPQPHPLLRRAVLAVSTLTGDYIHSHSALHRSFPANMHIFRRAAARAVSAPRQIRATPRVTSFQSSIPSLSRSFHQSRIWRAEEQKKEAEPTSSPQQDSVSESSGTTSEPIGQSEHQSQNVSESATESTQTPQSNVSPSQDALSESSGTTSEPVGQSEHQSRSETFTEQASEVAQKAKETVNDNAAKTAQAAGEFSTSQDKIQESASNATEKVQEAASNASEQAQSFASNAREQAQSAVSSMARAARNTAASARDTAEAHNPFTQGITPPSKILYIGNLFFEVTAPQLEAEFSKYGEVINSRVVTDNRGLSKGFAYIEFAKQDHAEEAVKNLNQKVFQGRRLSVQYHKRRTAGTAERSGKRSSAEPSKTLFIGNMSYQMSDRDLNDLFRQIKNVLDVRVAIDRRSGQPRGFAHADFIDVESASKAKEALEKKVVYGRQLRVDYSGQSSTTRGSDRGDRSDRGHRGDRGNRFDRD